MKIGVFDSGVGGKSVADAIEVAFPDLQIVFVSDSENLPYGNKTPEQLMGFVRPKIDFLVSAGCEVIVIACNTVTTNIIQDIRALFGIPFIGIEPMVKPASLVTKTGIIAVCATPATLASKRYAWLKKEYAEDIKVLEPDCSNWSRMIEDNQVNESTIRGIIDDVCSHGADVIVLGCTHYHWIESKIKKFSAGRAIVIQPEPAIIERLKSLLDDKYLV